MISRKSDNSTGDMPGTPMPLKQWGRYFDELIASKGLVQADVHRRSHRDPNKRVSKDTISKWVNGMSAPSLPALRKVAAGLNITLDQLYPGYEQHIRTQKEQTSMLRTYDPRLRRVENGNGFAHAPSLNYLDPDMKTAMISVSQVVSGDTARQIMELLTQDAANRV